ncbi:hypothetical protein M422DRAFT_31490 [Sphaerobolus stellatus SS14]|uniref:Squalene monooxygenase n=1 Tax=Sphaerobolus stellatus (strain SS14) TaxID=990650 RepID=A0A0C9V5E2_SPHS4|nr:hypothetical protein M422DRAFT_31490 [Sphaerobolus stellatus SS14]
MGIFHFLGFSLAFYAIYRFTATLTRNKLRAILTAVDDIPLLGLPRGCTRRIPGTAVVCGGSIAGLLTAKICGDHFDKVVIVEPEEWVTTEEGLHDRHRQALDNYSLEADHKRARVFQYTFMHGYQMFLPMALKKLFKNFEVEIRRAGGRLVPHDFQVYWSGIPFPMSDVWKGKEAPHVLGISRPLLETTLRRLVLESSPNVCYIAGSVVSMIQMGKDNVIQGVSIRPAGSSEVVQIAATMVADCTGPARIGFKCLKDLQSKSGATDNLEYLKKMYTHKLNTASFEFKIPSDMIPKLKALSFPGDFSRSWAVLNSAPDPDEERRGLGVICSENNTIHVACGGWGLENPPQTISEVREIASTLRLARPLPSWVIPFLDFLDKENLPCVHLHLRCPPAVWLQYHKATNLPSNFVALGDAVMNLNPLQGFGVTKACVDAVTLNGLLTRLPGNTLPSDFGHKFFDIQAKRIKGRWDQTKMEDYAYDTTIPSHGEDKDTYALWTRKFNRQLVKLLIKDPSVTATWVQTRDWLAPETDLLSPRILLKLGWMILSNTFSALF